MKSTAKIGTLRQYLPSIFCRIKTLVIRQISYIIVIIVIIAVISNVGTEFALPRTEATNDERKNMSVYYNIFGNDWMNESGTQGMTTNNVDAGVSPIQLQGNSNALEMARALQTSLDPEQLIQTFAEKCGEVIPHDSIQYINTDHEIDIMIGNKRKHTSTYNLLINGDSQGHIEFTRRKVFSDDEHQALEYMLSSLLYPLRNALMYQQALTSALRDPLTGTHNRASFNNQLMRDIEISRRTDSALSLMVLDIDYFKQINDEFGHLMGDRVLQVMAERAQNCIRGSDMLFRYGGEEFTILLNNTDKDGARLLAERIRHCISDRPIIFEEVCIDMTISIGIASLTEEDDNASLFDRADKALYEAKHTGRDKVVIHG